jgi:hypothetical protein
VFPTAEVLSQSKTASPRTPWSWLHGHPRRILYVAMSDVTQILQRIELDDEIRNLFAEVVNSEKNDVTIVQVSVRRSIDVN